jgi:hypothetical protein
MDNQDSNLTFRQYPIVNWIIGLIFLALAATYLPNRSWSAGAANLVLLIVEVAIGLFLILFGSIGTISADRVTQMLTVSFRSPLRSSKKEVPFAEIAAIQLEMNPSRSGRSRGGPTFRIVTVRKDGQIVPSYSYFSSRSMEKDRIVEKLRAYVGVGGDDPGFGRPFQAASQMARQKFQEQQETITGSEAEGHITDGVHWTLETKAFGGMPVSRWHSPDFKCDGNFLYLTQKVEGQGAQGGLMATMGRMVYKTSMTLFGFSGELTPNENRAEVLAPLDPQLENDFSAYTSDSRWARQILNPWAMKTLAAWAQSHPLTKSNRSDQLAILFSPEGLYLATMGLTNPEFLDEAAKLGAELVKAQGSVR